MFPVTYQPYQFIIKISDFCLDNWATIQRAEAEKHKSEWNQDEEDAYEAKLKELGEVGDELRDEANKTFGEFVEAQSANVVEIDASNINLSSITAFHKMGGGLAGATFDVSL